MPTKKILIVEDERIMRISLRDALVKEGYEVSIATTGEEGWEIIQQSKFHLALADLKLPQMNGLTFLKKIKELSPQVIVIMMTAFGTIENAVEAMKLGAYDYISKPFLNEELLLLIKKAFEFQNLKEENRFLWEELGERWKLFNLIGKSEKMQEIYRLIEVVALSNATVLIYGESGTGKELAAEAIHQLSLRKDKPLIKVSCSALPESLLESELFGFEKGAFTDASSRKLGRFELANGGALFLDDVDDMAPRVQAKLLRVLQERKFERLGGTDTIQVDVRVIAASRTNLEESVGKGNFREDLFYRLNVIPIFMPPLREKKEDIPLLVKNFLNRYTKEGKKIGISPEALKRLTKYSWPGNVRELENMIERMVTLSRGNKILPDDLPPNLLKVEKKEWGIKPIQEVLKKTEKQYIINVLAKTEGRKEEAAKVLGISRKTLWQKLKEYSI
ncbi:MAG: sigma-54-dependent transcriptional regulator [bacterium]